MAENEKSTRKRLIQELFGSDDESSDEDAPFLTSIEYSEILPGLKLFSQYLSVNNDYNEKHEAEKISHKDNLKGEMLNTITQNNNSSTTKKIKREEEKKISADQLLEIILANYPFTGKLNQVMSFGELPQFISPLVSLLESTPNLFPEEIMDRDPLFDQMICNYYEPGQGITPHVDLLSKFADGIVIVSLGSSCVMDFRPVTNIEEDKKYTENKNQHKNEGKKISVLLKPGDILSICGEARYNWTHGIEKCLIDEWEGTSIPRGKRVSITLRRLLPNAKT